jgi:hypothetical protein
VNVLLDKYDDYMAFRLVRFRMLWRNSRNQLKTSCDPPGSDYADNRAEYSVADCVTYMKAREAQALRTWHKWYIGDVDGPNAAADDPVL